jgi:acyl carrier protein
MMSEETATKIKEILAHELHLQAQNIFESDTLVADLGMDSLSSVELAARIEWELNVEISDSELGAAITVQNLIFLIEDKIANKPAPPEPNGP